MNSLGAVTSFHQERGVAGYFALEGIPPRKPSERARVNCGVGDLRDRPARVVVTVAFGSVGFDPFKEHSGNNMTPELEFDLTLQHPHTVAFEPLLPSDWRGQDPAEEVEVAPGGLGQLREVVGSGRALEPPVQTSGAHQSHHSLDGHDDRRGELVPGRGARRGGFHDYLLSARKAHR